MPRKWLRKKLPRHSKIRQKASVRWLGRLLDDPYLLHLNRRSVSMGVAIGLFNAFLPLLGQMPLATVMAILLRGNLLISVALVWVSNPLTMAFVLYWNYRLGDFLLGGWGHEVTSETGLDWWTANFMNVLPPLMLGGLITGLVAALIGYRTTRILWRLQVIKSWKRRKARLAEQQDHS